MRKICELIKDVIVGEGRCHTGSSQYKYFTDKHFRFSDQRYPLYPPWLECEDHKLFQVPIPICLKKILLQA